MIKPYVMHCKQVDVIIAMLEEADFALQAKRLTQLTLDMAGMAL